MVIVIVIVIVVLSFPSNGDPFAATESRPTPYAPRRLMFDSKRIVSSIPFVRRMNIVKTKNFVIAVAVRLYKVVASKMGVNNADKQVENGYKKLKKKRRAYPPPRGKWGWRWLHEGMCVCARSTRARARILRTSGSERCRGRRRREFFE